MEDGNDSPMGKNTTPAFPAPGSMGPSAPACTTEEEWRQLDWTQALEERASTAETRAVAAEGRAEAARYAPAELYRLPDKYDDMSQTRDGK